MYNKTVLDNGVRIISEKLKHLHSISLGIWVDSGSRDENQQENGISHFIEHMIFKGTRNRSSFQIAKELDAIGGMSNAFTGKEQTCFYARVLGRHFFSLADVFSDIFLNSMFTQDDLERERQVILQEISMVEDTPDDNIHVLFNNGFWKDHPIGMSIMGTEETVSSVTRETILSYMERYYIPEKIIVAAAGDVDHDALVSYFRPVLETLRGGNHNPGRTSPRSCSGTAVHGKDLEQVHICLGGESPPLKSDRRFSCTLLNTILGGNMSSRLFQEIRENLGLAYAIYSFMSAYRDTGMLGMYLATDASHVNPALQVIQREIKKINQGGLTEADLEAAKEHLIGGIYLSSESTDGRMMRLAKNEFNFNRFVSYEELVSHLVKVTKEEVIQLSRDIFRDNKVFLTTLGPLEMDELDLSCLRF